MITSPVRIQSTAFLICILVLGTVVGHARQAELTLSEIESNVAWMVNMERTHAGLNQLATDAQLSDIARKHSEEMRDEGYMAHESPFEDHRLPIDRYIKSVGRPPEALMENVGRVDRVGLAHTAPPRIHNGFMASPGHRVNILREGVSQMGIGCAIDSRGTIWTTELFAEPSMEAPGQAPAGAPGAPAGGPSPPATTGTPPRGTPAVAALEVGISRPVRTRIWRESIGPGHPLEVTVPIEGGLGIRVGVSTKTDAQLTAICTPPGDDAASALVEGAGSLNTQGELTPRSGDYVIKLTADQPVACRLVVITGPPQAVMRYGGAFRSPMPMAWDETLAGSLGDSDYPECFWIDLAEEQAGRIAVRALSPDFAGAIAIYDAADVLVGRVKCEASNSAFSLTGLAAGRYLVIMADGWAEAGTGDYEITLVNE